MGFISQAVSSAAISTALIAFAGFLLRNWIKERLTHSIKHEYDVKLAQATSDIQTENQKKLEAIKNELTLSSSIKVEEFKARLGAEYEVYKSKDLRYIEKQFELYNDLWTSLADLEIAVNDLWDVATVKKVKTFASQIIKTRQKIRKAALLIEDRHYLELNYVLDQFQEFQFGKQKLLEIKSSQVSDEDIEFDIGYAIGINKHTKDQLIETLSQMMNCLKSQIRHHEE